MTSFKFWEHNSKNILHIGTVGGWTKASTGYTFKNTSKKTIQLIAFLKAKNDFTHFRKKNRFWWYDLLLIDVLSSYNNLGSKLFSTLFKRNSLKNVFRFLDEETIFIEDLRIMLSMPPLRFIKALFRRVLNF
jgi:lycopene beta-cyclase